MAEGNKHQAVSNCLSEKDLRDRVGLVAWLGSARKGRTAVMDGRSDTDPRRVTLHPPTGFHGNVIMGTVALSEH